MRHIGAYIELAGLDLARAHREITAEVVASAVAALCVLFAVFMACLGVVAYTWDTAYRVSAIAWMGGGFLAIAIVPSVLPESMTMSCWTQPAALLRQYARFNSTSKVKTIRVMGNFFMNECDVRQ